MTALFEWLFKYRPLLYERGTFAFRPVVSVWVIILLIIIALLGAYWLYQRSARPLPPSWRYGLTGLRAAAFLLIIFIFSQPVLRVHSAIPQQNFVAVAYDTSRSMEIRDGEKDRSRLEIEQELLKPDSNALLKELADKFKLRFFRFSGSAERTAAFENAPRYGHPAAEWSPW